MTSRRVLALMGSVAASLVSAGPCDIYEDGGTPCVAAHSTTRALYDGYSSALYQVTRASDDKTKDITPLKAGGVADASIQQHFCSGTTCEISAIYDQSGSGNTLTQAPGGTFSGPEEGGWDSLAAAFAAPVTLNGKTVYGVKITPGTGYRNNDAAGIATGDQAEGMYAILDGTDYNGGCCFDYGNAEPSTTDTGNGHMETIYFGNRQGKAYGSGPGPWILADLENGLFAGPDVGENDNNPTINYRFVTAIVKGEPNHWAIRGGDATEGGLTSFWDGKRPSNGVSGYNPMKKEGAIVLGVGGDNSNEGQGTFYEGVMTSGYPTDATENKVQADIVAAGYAT